MMAHLQRNFPNVTDVHLSRGGVCRYHLCVQIEKRFDGEAKNVIMGAFAGHYDVKQVVVVDTDVNIHDAAEVEWAIATRSQADRDLLIVADAQGSSSIRRAGTASAPSLASTPPFRSMRRSSISSAFAFRAKTASTSTR